MEAYFPMGGIQFQAACSKRCSRDFSPIKRSLYSRRARCHYATVPSIQNYNGAELVPMRNESRLLSLALLCASMAACGGISSDTCVVTTAIAPVNATADHNATAPGNEVQFSLSSTVKGNCPLIPDFVGVWSTSDPVNTSISNQTSTQGLATCMSATPTPATISNSGTVTGKGYPSVTLVCK